MILGAAIVVCICGFGSDQVAEVASAAQSATYCGRLVMLNFAFVVN